MHENEWPDRPAHEAVGDDLTARGLLHRFTNSVDDELSTTTRDEIGIALPPDPTMSCRDLAELILAVSAEHGLVPIDMVVVVRYAEDRED